MSEPVAGGGYLGPEPTRRAVLGSVAGLGLAGLAGLPARRGRPARPRRKAPSVCRCC